MKEAPSSFGVARVWLIEKESGITLFSYEPSQKIDGTLFGGLLAAIRDMINEIEIGQLSSISTDTHELMITVSEHIISTFILEKGFSTECLYPLLIKLDKDAEVIYQKMKSEINYVETEYFSPLNEKIFEMFSSQAEFADQHCDDNDDTKSTEAQKKLEESGLW